MIDLDYLYAHHAVGLCPEERCVTARANLAALAEEMAACREAYENNTAERDMYEIAYRDLHRVAVDVLARDLPPNIRTRLEAVVMNGDTVASREGSGT